MSGCCGCRFQRSLTRYKVFSPQMGQKVCPSCWSEEKKRMRLLSHFLSGTKSQETVVDDAFRLVVDRAREGAPSPRTFAGRQRVLRLGSHPGL